MAVTNCFTPVYRDNYINQLSVESNSLKNSGLSLVSDFKNRCRRLVCDDSLSVF